MTDATIAISEDSRRSTASLIATAISEEQLVSEYRASLNRMLRRITGDEARAEDLTHETLMLVLEKLRGEGLRDPEKLSSFVYSTARYLHLGWNRKRSNQEICSDHMDEQVDAGTDIEQAIIQEEARESLMENIGGLNLERDRQILLRFYMQEQTKDEICEALVLDKDHFDRVISRARKRLRERISADDQVSPNRF